MAGRLRTALIGLCLVAVCAPGAAYGASYAYVANDRSLGTVSQYAVGADGGLSALVPPTVTTGSYPFGVAVRPDRKSAYVANGSGLSQYDIDPLHGTLSSKTPASVSAGADPDIVAVSPDGLSAYVTNSSGGSVTQYDIDSVSGRLSPKSPASVATGLNPNTIALTSDGRSAYVANGGDGTVTQYDVDPVSGNLSPKSPRNVSAGRAPYGIAVSPNGESAFVTSGDAIFQFAIDSVSGALSPKIPGSVAAGPNALGIVLTADGRNAYVADPVASMVYQYDVDELGETLSPKSRPVINAGQLPWSVAVTADGKNAYVGAFDGVYQFDIDSSSGQLAAKDPPRVAPTQAGGIAVTPPPNLPPDCERVVASRPVLGTVNHRLVAITLEGATNPNGDSLTLSVEDVTQDEPVRSRGDHTSPDAIDGGDGELRVRAERSSRGDGRVYRIAFTASDGRGGECSGTATVSVPRKKRAPAVDSAPPSYDSFAR